MKIYRRMKIYGQKVIIYVEKRPGQTKGYGIAMEGDEKPACEYWPLSSAIDTWKMHHPKPKRLRRIELRLPEESYQKLVAQATGAGRGLTAQIEYWIEKEGFVD